MIIYEIPHTAQFIPCNAVFSATFAAGSYTITSVTKNLCSMIPQQIYLVDRMSFAASIPESDYTASLNIANLPLLSVFGVKAGARMAAKYALPLYKPDAAFANWYRTDSQQGSYLACSLSGALNQVANTVGIATINFALTFDVYAIASTAFSENFRDTISADAGVQIRGR